ncbi:conserved hypothetical protein [Burkholderia pseudomallei Pasteur 52237]|nr:conserved hypothetical protein [Burkholderia pseudomallei Pasteur 52237]
MHEPENRRTDQRRIADRQLALDLEQGMRYRHENFDCA